MQSAGYNGRIGGMRRELAALLVASHNIIFIQLAGVVRSAMRSLFDTTETVGSNPPEALALHLAVVEAVRLRQPEEAVKAMSQILDMAERDLRHAGMDRKASRQPAPRRCWLPAMARWSQRSQGSRNEADTRRAMKSPAPGILPYQPTAKPAPGPVPVRITSGRPRRACGAPARRARRRVDAGARGGAPRARRAGAGRGRRERFPALARPAK